MRRRTVIRWEIAAVALTLILATISPSPAVRIALIALGAVLLLLALGLPQRLARAAFRLVADLVRLVQSEHRLVAARQHCEAAIEQLSALLSSTSARPSGRDRVRNLLRIGGTDPRSALGTYQTRLQALTTVAVEEALRAGAFDGGSLARARSPRGTADLHELLTGLLRMIGEMDSDTEALGHARASGRLSL